MTPTYRPSLKTLIPAYLISNYLGLLIYTLYYYRNDPFRALQATPASGLYIPVSSIEQTDFKINFIIQI